MHGAQKRCMSRTKNTIQSMISTISKSNVKKRIKFENISRKGNVLYLTMEFLLHTSNQTS